MIAPPADLSGVKDLPKTSTYYPLQEAAADIKELPMCCSLKGAFEFFYRNGLRRGRQSKRYRACRKANVPLGVMVNPYLLKASVTAPSAGAHMGLSSTFNEIRCPSGPHFQAPISSGEKSDFFRARHRLLDAALARPLQLPPAIVRVGTA